MRRGDDDEVSVDLVYLDATREARRFEDERGRDVWLPKSLASCGGELVHGRAVSVTMPEWLAQNRGLI